MWVLSQSSKLSSASILSIPHQQTVRWAKLELGENLTPTSHPPTSPPPSPPPPVVAQNRLPELFQRGLAGEAGRPVFRGKIKMLSAGGARGDQRGMATPLGWVAWSLAEQHVHGRTCSTSWGASHHAARGHRQRLWDWRPWLASCTL